MRRIFSIPFFIFIFSLIVFPQSDSLRFPGEKHLANIKMLTDSGENAEAYFSFDEKKLIYQSNNDDLLCDQIFEMNIDLNLDENFPQLYCAELAPAQKIRPES